MILNNIGIQTVELFQSLELAVRLRHDFGFVYNEELMRNLQAIHRFQTSWNSIIVILLSEY